jgi:hypothetical protein
MRIGIGVVLLVVVVVVSVTVLLSGGPGGSRFSSNPWRKLLSRGSVLVATGPHGGTVWRVRIPNSFVNTHRSGYVYLPRYGSAERYPVVYLLHGFPGSPRTFVVRGSSMWRTT